MATVEIHRATRDDIAELASLHVRAWQWAYRRLIPDEVLDSLNVERRAASWYRMLSDQRIPAPHVATVDSRIVGFAHADTARDEVADREVGEVSALYLRRDYISTGLGRRLWDAALAQLRENGHTAVVVWVLDTNQRGRHFYERMGLVADGAAKEQTMGGATLTEIRYRSSLVHS